jgi:hypothetical protein
VTTPAGPRQAILLARAQKYGSVMTRDEAERCAARRLVARDVLSAQRFGGSRFGYITVYKIVQGAQ